MNKIIIAYIILLAFGFITPLTKASETASKSSRPNFIEKFQERKEERAEKIEKFKEKRQEFKEKLEQIKDSRKKAIAQKADEKLAKINKNSTDRMNLAIGKLETLLNKFASRAATLKTEGKDTITVDSAIVTAKDAISDAKDAVTSQANKVYTADLSDETTLKNNFGQTMSQLRKDLNTTHDIVKLAKQKVMDVARALAKLKMPTPTI